MLRQAGHRRALEEARREKSPCPLRRRGEACRVRAVRTRSADGVSSRGRLTAGSVEEALPKGSTALRRVHEREKQKAKRKEVKSLPGRWAAAEGPLAVPHRRSEERRVGKEC